MAYIYATCAACVSTGGKLRLVYSFFCKVLTQAARSYVLLTCGCVTFIGMVKRKHRKSFRADKHESTV